jgi:hypothetical protein
MKLHIILVLLLACSLSSAEAPEPQYDYNDRNRAAYFGEATKLEEMIGPKENFYKISGLNPSVLVGHAMASGHRNVVELILRYGWPKSATSLRNVFTNHHMTPDMVSVFAENIPDFTKDYGPKCLVWAIGAGHDEVAIELIKLGVPLTDDRRSPLIAALHTRNIKLINTLLANGADPYIGRARPKRYREPRWPCGPGSSCRRGRTQCPQRPWVPPRRREMPDPHANPQGAVPFRSSHAVFGRGVTASAYALTGFGATGRVAPSPQTGAT